MTVLASPLEVAVAGVTFRSDYPNSVFAVSGLLATGRQVPACLVPDPETPADVNAIKVLIGGEHVGYIPAFLAKQLTRDIEKGNEWRAFVDRLIVSPQNPDQPGLRLKVFRYDTERQLI